MFRNLSSFESSLFDDFRRMEQQLDQLFGEGYMPHSIRSVARGSFPPINIGTTPDQVDIYIFAAGVDPKALEISIQQNLLTVDGERLTASEKEASGYYRQERFNGKFHRVVTLPDDVDPDQVEASYRDGVLRVTVKRRESTKPRQIEIN
ncbi:MAG: Hsp20/alpha crystallin family protein [Candidatus Thiodiazotropha sp.]|jgi:HSP20 family protein